MSITPSIAIFIGFCDKKYLRCLYLQVFRYLKNAQSMHIIYNIKINSVVLFVFTFNCFSMNMLTKSRIEKHLLTKLAIYMMVWHVHLWYVHPSVLPIVTIFTTLAFKNFQ